VHPADVPSLRITEEADGTTTVLRLAGELDLATADILRERVRALATTTSGVRRLTLDLGGLEFLDVTGLGALLEARRRLGERGATVALRRPRPMVRRMLSLLSLEDALQIED
jgi:anti-anti-sigma factor